MQAKREHWGGQLAFVLATAGSAVGLGNIWKFPYLAGQHGGSAFVLIYLLCVLVFGLPLMLCEFVIGRTAQKDAVGSFVVLAPNTRWWLVGVLGILTGLIILSYYSVVAGWSLHYIWETITWAYGRLDASAMGTHFGAFTADYRLTILWHAVFMGLCVAIVVGGVKEGIEFWSKILMPLLFAMLLFIVGWVFFLPGAWRGYEFLFALDLWKALKPDVVIAALGQAFFSLGVGMGCLITYGSYMKKEDNLFSSALWVMIADTGVALLAGLAIFPAVFSFGLKPASGPGLVFCTLPAIFKGMSGGRFIGLIFFVALAIAAVTSAISLVEVIVAYLIDEKGMERMKATILVGVAAFLLGVPTALSFAPSTPEHPFGLKDATIDLLGAKLTFFDVVEKFTSNICLPVGGALIVSFILFGWGLDQAVRNLEEGTSSGWRRFSWWWAFLLRIVVPVLLLLTMAYSFGLFGFDAHGGMVLLPVLGGGA